MRPEGALPNKVMKEGGRGPKKSVLLRLVIAILVGIGISELLYWMGDLLGLSHAAVFHRVWVACAVLLAAIIALALWARRRNRFTRVCNDLMPLLESDVNAYITGYEALRKQWKGAFYQRYICLNLVAGYHSRGDLDTALDLLHQAATCRLPGVTRTVWASDLAMNAFRREKWQEGLAIMEREKEALSAMATLENGKAPSAWWLLCLYRLIARGETDKAREVLPQVEAQFTAAGARDTLAHIRKVLERGEQPGARI